MIPEFLPNYPLSSRWRWGRRRRTPPSIRKPSSASTKPSKSARSTPTHGAPLWKHNPVCEVTPVILHGVVFYTAPCRMTGVTLRRCVYARCPRAHREREREFFIDDLLVRIHFIIVMMRWAGLAPWEYEFPCQVTLHLSSYPGAPTRGKWSAMAKPFISVC